MADVGVSAVRLIDSDGDALDDISGKLKTIAVLHVATGPETYAATPGGEGVITPGTPRVTIATDDTMIAVVIDLKAAFVAVGANAKYLGHKTIASGRNTDIGTTAETIAAFGASIVGIDIQASPDNTGYIYVGDSGVAGDGSGGGIRLAAGDFYSLIIDSMADIYVAASVNGEDVYYNYYTNLAI